MRLTYIDCLKGFLIILVAIGHCIQMSNVYFANDIVFRYIYSFHMPLFFAVSGFVSYKIQLSLSDLKKRIFQLILPFFCWWFLHWIFESKLSFFASFIMLMHSPDNGLWFLWVLFFCILIFHLFDKLSEFFRLKKEIVIIFGAGSLYLIYLVSNFRYLGFQFIAWYFMFYSLGFYLRKYEIYFYSKINILLTSSLLLFTVGAWFSVIKGSPTFYEYFDLGVLFSYVYKFLIALLGIIFAFTFFKKTITTAVENSKVVGLLNKLGRMTLGIYAIHCTYIYVFLRIPFSLPYYLLISLLLVLSLMSSYFSVLIIRTNNIFSLLLLGESKNKK